MYHANIFKCDSCGNEIEIDADFTAGVCPCGGVYFLSGESYDQEFVDQERYERKQDYEYEQRHRGDYY